MGPSQSRPAAARDEQAKIVDRIPVGRTGPTSIKNPRVVMVLAGSGCLGLTQYLTLDKLYSPNFDLITPRKAERPHTSFQPDPQIWLPMVEFVISSHSLSSAGSLQKAAHHKAWTAGLVRMRRDKVLPSVPLKYLSEFWRDQTKPTPARTIAQQRHPPTCTDALDVLIDREIALVTRQGLSRTARQRLLFTRAAQLKGWPVHERSGACACSADTRTLGFFLLLAFPRHGGRSSRLLCCFWCISNIRVTI
ncbi:hypothetical protein B0H63DRAFT_466621 [Podospora didyma]|uniref:Uncharacterized protein n=1 Tax=Podospora didyma TaxID=330526 RepID=A0AAE0U558_9PEZI|nr:hypothetical protein B0H63DRAFT_466621 [Podospora didyma]